MLQVIGDFARTNPSAAAWIFVIMFFPTILGLSMLYRKWVKPLISKIIHAVIGAFR